MNRMYKRSLIYNSVLADGVTGRDGKGGHSVPLNNQVELPLCSPPMYPDPAFHSRWEHWQDEAVGIQGFKTYCFWTLVTANPIRNDTRSGEDEILLELKKDMEMGDFLFYLISLMAPVFSPVSVIFHCVFTLIILFFSIITNVLIN